MFQSKKGNAVLHLLHNRITILTPGSYGEVLAAIIQYFPTVNINILNHVSFNYIFEDEFFV